MAEALRIPQTDNREVVYHALIPQVSSVFSGETDLIANAANLVAILHESFGFLWTGFYFIKQETLVLGPFQGPLACTRIHYGKGVCGTAWKNQEVIIVPDVDLFPGHIACSDRSRSEIVVPVFSTSGAIMGVLDIDSELKNDFSQVDKKYLEKLTSMLVNASVE